MFFAKSLGCSLINSSVLFGDKRKKKKKKKTVNNTSININSTKYQLFVSPIHNTQYTKKTPQKKKKKKKFGFGLTPKQKKKKRNKF